MKFAFSTLACPEWSTEQIVNNAAQMGYDGIELRLLDGNVLEPVRDAAKIKDAIALAHQHKITTCALDTSCRFNIRSAEERARHIAELREWIHLAHEVKVPILRIFGGNSEIETDPQTEEKDVADALRQVAQEAEHAGVTVVLETHDAFSSVHRVANVLLAVDSPAIAALWDSHHPYRMGESAEEVMGILAGRIAHVHVKDARRLDANQWQLVLAGAGEVPIVDQLRLLHQHGYDGFVAVEWEKRWHPEIADPEIALPQHIAWLKQVVQQF